MPYDLLHFFRLCLYIIIDAVCIFPLICSISNRLVVDT